MLDHGSRAMPKRPLIPLPDKVAATLLDVLVSIYTVPNDRLVLRRPNIDRRPEMTGQKTITSCGAGVRSAHQVPGIQTPFLGRL